MPLEYWPTRFGWKVVLVSDRIFTQRHWTEATLQRVLTLVHLRRQTQLSALHFGCGNVSCRFTSIKYLLSSLMCSSPWKNFIYEGVWLIFRSWNSSNSLTFYFSVRLEEFVKHLLRWFRRRTGIILLLFHGRRLVHYARILTFLCPVLLILLLFFHLISNDLQKLKYTLKVILFNFIIHIRKLTPSFSWCNLAILILVLAPTFIPILKILFRITTVLKHYIAVVYFLSFKHKNVPINDNILLK